MTLHDIAPEIKAVLFSGIVTREDGVSLFWVRGNTTCSICLRYTYNDYSDEILEPEIVWVMPEPLHILSDHYLCAYDSPARLDAMMCECYPCDSRQGDINRWVHYYEERDDNNDHYWCLLCEDGNHPTHPEI